MAENAWTSVAVDPRDVPQWSQEAQDRLLGMIGSGLPPNAFNDVLRSGANAEGSPRHKDDPARVPLLRAVAKKDLSAVLTLLQWGADANASHGGFVALDFVDNNTIAVVLLLADADPLKSDPSDGRPQAAERIVKWGDFVTCKVMFDKGTPVESKYLFCALESPDVVRLLLQRGADPNVQDTDGCTPLLRACGLEEFDEFGFWHTEGSGLLAARNSVGVLLEHGADPDERGATIFRPIQVALDTNRMWEVYWLVRGGATPTRLETERVSPLYRCICADMFPPRRVVQAFVDGGCDVNEENYRGVSILSKAIKHGFWELVQVLVRQGADCEHDSVVRRTKDDAYARRNLMEFALVRELWAANAPVDSDMIESGADADCSAHTHTAADAGASADADAGESHT